MAQKMRKPFPPTQSITINDVPSEFVYAFNIIAGAKKLEGESKAQAKARIFAELIQMKDRETYGGDFAVERFREYQAVLLRAAKHNLDEPD